MVVQPTSSGPLAQLPDGLIAIVKADCPACSLIQPVFADLAKRVDLTVYTQDDP
ncbi:uncharacterized protein METZ01_LOCUS369063, partial [marine metagenome]